MEEKTDTLIKDKDGPLKQKDHLIKQNFPVTGMTCASCAVSVESILKSQTGVVDAGVNYASQSAQVTFNPDKITPASLKKAIQSIGYDLILEAEEGKDAEAIHQQQLKALKRRTILASALSIPVVVIGMWFHDIPFASWIMLLLTAPVVFWFGRSFFLMLLNKHAI